MTAAEFRAMLDAGKVTKKGRVKVWPEALETRKSGNKFNAQPQADPETGKRVDSKQELKHRQRFRLMLKAGEILSYAWQPEFMLEAGVKYRADHLIVHLDGSIEVYDTKGVETADFKIKWKQVQKRYPKIRFTKLR